MKDHATKFVWLAALPNKKSLTIVNALKAHLSPWWPIIRKVHSDNGREFVNKDMDKLLGERQIEYRHGKVRKPNVQGLVEQSNCTVKNMLWAQLQEMKRDDWVEALPDIAGAYVSVTTLALLACAQRP